MIPARRCASSAAVVRLPKRSKPRNAPIVLPRTMLEHSVVHEHLRSLAAVDTQPTLNDLEHCRPKEHSDPSSDSYPSEYSKLHSLLLRKFSAAQLRQFAKGDLGLSMVSSARKSDYACAIMEQHWDWVSLSKAEEHKRLWKVHASTELPITPREFFFVLGKDGVGLRKLSSTHDVHISPISSSSSRVKAMLVEGLQGSLNAVSVAISQLKKDVIESDFKLDSPMPLPPPILLRISRLSGALVDQVEPGWLRVSYLQSDINSEAVAKRLVIRAASEAITRPPVYYYLPAATSRPFQATDAEQSSYALFPFFTSQSLPWNLTSSTLFRVRRVGEWLGVQGTENIRWTGGLSGERGQIVSSSLDHVDIRQILLASFPSSLSSPGKISVEALTGHIVAAPPSGTRPSILPPLKGQWPMSKFSHWLAENPDVHQSFVPGLSTRVFNTVPTSQEILHRIEYRSHPSPEASSDRIPTEVLRLEVVLPSNSKEIEGASFLCRGSKGQMTTLCLLSGDRPMDLQFSALSLQELPENLFPENLKTYLSTLSNHLPSETQPDMQPEIPLTLEIDGVQYMLHSNTRIRRSIDAIPPNVDDNAHVVSESLLDHETDQKLSQCHVTCSDITSDQNWRRFLGHCDWLTTLPVAEYDDSSFKDVHALSQEAGIDDLYRTEKGLKSPTPFSMPL